MYVCMASLPRNRSRPGPCIGAAEGILQVFLAFPAAAIMLPWRRTSSWATPASQGAAPASRGAAPASWCCTACTLENRLDAQACAACGAPRPHAARQPSEVQLRLALPHAAQQFLERLRGCRIQPRGHQGVQVAWLPHAATTPEHTTRPPKGSSLGGLRGPIGPPIPTRRRCSPATPPGQTSRAQKTGPPRGSIIS